MKKSIQKWTIVLFICSILIAGVLPSLVATEGQQIELKTINQQQMVKSTTSGYSGNLRVYIVEPVSRWNNYNQEPYHFGFLGYAFNENISLEPQITLEKSITWDGDAAESNVMVIAVVFNSYQNQGYANPPRRNPFIAYYTDATAAAKPGYTGYNSVTTNFTHTVFVEEATATWCPYCPAMANALHTVYETGEYPFYFVALVDDKSDDAAARHEEFNIYGFPSAFIDGGYRVLVGGYDNPNIYINQIKSAGIRKVPALNLSVNVAYIGSGDLQIGVNITSNNLPPVKPQTPSGEIDGNIQATYNYTTTTTDPNNDDVWYMFDWGDGNISGWIGPYASGADIITTHSWIKKGNYEIKVKAMDSSNSESTWSDPLPITMPYSYNEPILKFLSQRFPYLFSILKQIFEN